MALDRQITANVGLYYSCYHLSRLGWNVMPTARNARGLDIIAYSRDSKRFVGIQVKALSERHAVPLGKSIESLMGDFWIIINRVASEPSAYILQPSEVHTFAQRDKGGQRCYWLPRNAYEQDEFKEAWGRIGQG